MSAEKLKAAALADKGEHTLVTTASGLKFEVRSPSAGDKARYADALKGATSKEGMAATDIVNELMTLTARCVYDPESGARVFKDDEAGELAESRVADELSDAVQKFLKASQGKAGKESEETPSSAAVSSSEKPSESP